MSKDPLDDFERMFGLPEDIEGLGKKIDKMEKTIQAADPAGVGRSVDAAFQATVRPSVLLMASAADDAKKAADRLDEERGRLPRRRRIVIGLLSTVAALAIFVAGIGFGISPTVTTTAIHTRPGCSFFGGQWVSSKGVTYCAFQVL